jgi:hypothetical protein
MGCEAGRAPGVKQRASFASGRNRNVLRPYKTVGGALTGAAGYAEAPA